MPRWSFTEICGNANAAPFAGYFDLGDFAIVSASPERFRARSPATWKHGRSKERGRAAQRRWRIRNRSPSWPLGQGQGRERHDRRPAPQRLGPGLRYGTSARQASAGWKPIDYVHHLVRKCAAPAPDWTPWTCCGPAFPGGSVTGAPKVRAMEIIAELEPTAAAPTAAAWAILDSTAHGHEHPDPHIHHRPGLGTVPRRRRHRCRLRSRARIRGNAAQGGRTLPGVGGMTMYDRTHWARIVSLRSFMTIRGRLLLLLFGLLASCSRPAPVMVVPTASSESPWFDR